MRQITKYLILAHRYLGIALGLLVVMWFVSGMVMLYGGEMPRLTPQLRLERLPDLDLSRIQLTPANAAERVRDATGAEPAEGRTRLQMVMDRPAYRLGGETVFADTGDLFEGASLEQSKAIAARFMNVPDARVHHAGTITRIDQWTIEQSRAMPLHKFRVDDDAGTELYVQPSSGDVITLTTRRGRALAWMGTIPHWFYFAALREHQPLWYRSVVWTSAAVCVLAVIGLVLAIVRFRRTTPFRLSKAIPYSGWMRWHYVTGVVFGLFTVTWAFSGMISMEPFAWTNATGLRVPPQAMTGGPADLSAFDRIDAARWAHVLGRRAIKEVEFSRMQDEHYYVVRLAAETPLPVQRRERLHQPYNISGRVEHDRLFVRASDLEVRREPFTTASLLGRLEAALPGVPVVQSELLADYDSYYYSRGRQTPLPVLRVKFADPADTWVYVDPETSQVLASIHRLNRVERWVYNGLHSLDFSFWYSSRPLWDIGMLTLLIGGLATTCLGLLMGVKRLKTRTARVPSSRPVQAPAGVMPRGNARRPADAILTPHEARYDQGTTMAVKSLPCILLLAFAATAHAQSSAIDIRATGEHRTAIGDTADSSRQLALADARRKAWEAAAGRLRGRAEVKALQLKPSQLEAFTLVILEIEEQAGQASQRPLPSAVQVRVSGRLDGGDAVRRMTALRKDQDATYDLVEAWKETQQLYDVLAGLAKRRAGAAPGEPDAIVREQLETVSALRAKQLSARVTAALARTEESAVGGRAPTAAGREQARMLAESALTLAPDSPDAHEVMGDLLLDALEPEAAAAEFRKSLAAANSSSNRTKLAEALRLQGEFPEAIAELREALRLDPESARAHSGLGLALRAQKNLTESIAEYREAIRLDPDLIDAHNGLAVALANQGDLDAAVAAFREIIRIDPDSAIGYYNLAYALADLDRDVESAAALREVVRINPNHYNARYNLGELFRLEGKYDDSARQFREYLRLAPDIPQNRRNIERAKGFIEKFEGP